MNERRYRIYDGNDTALNGYLQQDLRKRIAHEVNSLPTELDLRLSEFHVEVDTSPDPVNPDLSIFVTLKGNLSDDSFDSLLNDCIRNVNAQAWDLCFLIERID